jgi:hypothetical protein
MRRRVMTMVRVMTMARVMTMVRVTRVRMQAAS